MQHHLTLAMPEKKRKSRRREEERGVDEEEDAAPLSLNTFAAAAEDALVRPAAAVALRKTLSAVHRPLTLRAAAAVPSLPFPLLLARPAACLASPRVQVDDALLEKDAALRRAQELIDADERRLAAQDDDEDDDEDDDDEDEEEEEESKRQVLFRPGVDEMGEGEELDYDPTGTPCVFWTACPELGSA